MRPHGLQDTSLQKARQVIGCPQPRLKSVHTECLLWGHILIANWVSQVRQSWKNEVLRTGSERTVKSQILTREQRGSDDAERPIHRFLPAHGAVEPCALNSSFLPGHAHSRPASIHAVLLYYGRMGEYRQRTHILQQAGPCSLTGSRSAHTPKPVYLHFLHVRRPGAQNHRRGSRTNQLFQNILESFRDCIHSNRLVLPRDKEVAKSFHTTHARKRQASVWLSSLRPRDEQSWGHQGSERSD